jgi:hypothetical protein
MSDIETNNWSEAAASNNAAPPNGMPEGMAPSGVNDAGREIISAIKREWDRSHPTATSGGSANAQTLSYSVNPTVLAQGQDYSFIAGFTTTGAATLQVGSLAAKNVFMDNAALTGGEIQAGAVVTVCFDGTQYQIVSSRALAATVVKNWLINGDMEVWQRGAGGSASIAVAASTTAYTADRWYITTGSNQAFTISQQTGLTNGSRFCMRVQRNSGQTGTGQIVIGQPLDSDFVAGLRGKIVTISAKLRSGANWSPASGAISMALYVGTGSPAKRGGGFTSETTVASVTTNLGTSSSVMTAPATASSAVPTNAGQGELQFAVTPSGTASTNDWVEIDDVMICIAPFATVFDRRRFDEEMTTCQRFYQKSFDYPVAPAQNAGTTHNYVFRENTAASVSDFNDMTPYPGGTMRVTPTITTYNPGAPNTQVIDVSASADCSGTTVAGGEKLWQLNWTNAASGAVGHILRAHASFEAEI